jgi:uncharacterized membrane protein
MPLRVLQRKKVDEGCRYGFHIAAMESETDVPCSNSEAGRPPSITGRTPRDGSGSDDPSAIDLSTKAERRVLAAGIALTLGFLAWLGFEIMVCPEHLHALLLTTLLTATLGRPTAITIAYEMKLPRLTIFEITAIVETVVVLVFYPLIAFSCQQIVTIRPLQNACRRFLETAQTHRTSIQRYGPLGLCVFVAVVPYGSLIGAVIGFLLRMPVWLNLTAVLGATYVSTFLWTVFLHRIHALASSCGRCGTVILVAVVLAIAIVGHLTHRVSLRKTPRI